LGFSLADIQFSNKAQKIAYLSAIFDKFIMKKMALIQLSDVSFLLAFILLRPYAFFACPNFPSIRFLWFRSFLSFCL